MIMKYKVDDSCVCCGACTAVCPTVFFMGDSGRAAAIADDVPEDALEDAEDAMGGCPVGAIHTV